MDSEKGWQVKEVVLHTFLVLRVYENLLGALLTRWLPAPGKTDLGGLGWGL